MILVRPGRALLLALAVFAADALAQDRTPPPGGRVRLGMADPSAVIAADFALGRIARSKGEAEALRQAAAPAALVLAPRPLPAAAFLKRLPSRPLPADWQPQTVWMSCDGGYALSRGRWRRGAASGDYVALWQRQQKGDWRWLMHEEGGPAPPAEEVDMITGKVAECADLPRRPPGFVPPPVSPLNDASRDGSLEWTARLTARCDLTLTVRAWDGKSMREVLSWTRPPPAQGCA